MKRKYTWYVKPLDAQTNSAIAELAHEEHFCHKTKMWKCDLDIIMALRRSRESLDLKFRIFNQEGNGQIRECPEFIFVKRRRRKKALPRQLAR